MSDKTPATPAQLSRDLIRSFCDTVALNKNGQSYIDEYLKINGEKYSVEHFYNEVPLDFQRIFASRLCEYPGFKQKYPIDMVVLSLEHETLYYNFDGVDNAIKAVKDILEVCLNQSLFPRAPSNLDEAMNDLKKRARSDVDFMLIENLFKDYCAKNFDYKASDSKKLEVLENLAYIFSRQDLIEDKKYQAQIGRVMKHILIPGYRSQVYWNGLYDYYISHYGKPSIKTLDKDFYRAIVLASYVLDAHREALSLLEGMKENPEQTVYRAFLFLFAQQTDYEIECERFKI